LALLATLVKRVGRLQLTNVLAAVFWWVLCESAGSAVPMLARPVVKRTFTLPIPTIPRTAMEFELLHIARVAST